MAAPTSAPQTTGDDKSVGADASSVPHIDRFFGSSVDMEIDAIIARAPQAAQTILTTNREADRADWALKSLFAQYRE